MIHLPGMASFPAVTLLFGVLQGLTFGLLGVGLVLVYRSSRFINFAHGDIGAFGAAVLGYLAVKGHVPYWVALPLGMLVAAAVGGAVEVGVVRRLAGAPRLMSMVASIGAGQFLALLSLAVLAEGTAQELYPQPAGLPSFKVQGQLVSQSYVAIAVLAPLSVAALVVFFRRSRFGLAIRGASANPEAASMAGMSPQRLATLAWALAGALSCLTAALLIPNLGQAAGGSGGASSLGPYLLVRALAGAVVARMDGLALTFGAGVGIGLVDYVLSYVYPGTGWTDVVLFAVILVALLLQAKPGRREEEKGSWNAVQAWPPLPEAFRNVRLIRHGGLLVGAGFFALASIVPFVWSNSTTFSLGILASFAVVGLSLTIMTGLSGQLSLGQFAMAAVGAVGGIWATQHVGDLSIALVVAAAIGAAAALIVGLPALRVRGLLLAVTSLAFAVAVSSFLLPRRPPLGFGTSESLGTTSVLGISMRTPHQMWWLVLAVLAIALVATRNVVRSGFGRVLVALRDNEDAARAFGVFATRRKLQGYAVAGALAGLGGGLYTVVSGSVGPGAVTPTYSVLMIVITVVGGAGVVMGPVLGVVVALPLVVALTPGEWALITFGWLGLILHAPNGIAGVLRPARDRVVSAVARFAGVDTEAAWASADPARAPAAIAAPATAAPRQRTSKHSDTGDLLVVRGVEKRYGGLLAVGGVDLEVRSGEVLGLIGPNGAGKTTLFECLSGFVTVDAGSIVFDGKDITRWSPERRAAVGLIRSFQDSALFSTMTVLETLLVAEERRSPSSAALAVLGVAPGRRGREERARELLALLGLDRYRHVQVGGLSTGTRRITELACVLALEPRLLLLDEPSSGVAQKEVEALGDLLNNVRRQLGTTLVVIEHDIPLVSALSDRIVAMETGCVLAVGSPGVVLADPRVVESYLGGDPTAVQRSGVAMAREAH